MKKYFSARLISALPEHLIIFEASLLDEKLKLANPLTKKVLEQECRQLCQRLNEHATVKDKIRHELLFLEGDFPTLDHLAHRINIPERTIRRKLTAWKGLPTRIFFPGFASKRRWSLLQRAITPWKKSLPTLVIAM